MKGNIASKNNNSNKVDGGRQPKAPPLPPIPKRKGGLGKAPSTLRFGITAMLVLAVAYIAATYSTSVIVPILKSTLGSKKGGGGVKKEDGEATASSSPSSSVHAYSDDGFFSKSTDPSIFTNVGLPSVSSAPNTPFYQNMTALGASCSSLSSEGSSSSTNTNEDGKEADRFTFCVPKSRRCTRAVLDLSMTVDEDDNDVEKVAASTTFAPKGEIPPPTSQDIYLLAQKSLVEQRPYSPTNIRDRIVAIMENVLNTIGRGGGSGPVSLVEANRGIYSVGDKFASLPLTIVKLLKQDKNTELPLSPDNLAFLWSVFKGVERHVSEFLFCSEFPCASAEQRADAHEVGAKTLYLATPSFFSKISAGKSPKNDNDEYWHLHIDRLQYGSFAVTTLLYLDNMSEAGSSMYSSTTSAAFADDDVSKSEECTEGKDFSGGGFVFERDLKAVVHPSSGRLSMFTSSSENPHYVDRVRCGSRRALTIAFTCDADVGTKLGASYAGSSLFKVVEEALLFDPATQDVEEVDG